MREWLSDEDLNRIDRIANGCRDAETCMLVNEVRARRATEARFNALDGDPVEFAKMVLRAEEQGVTFVVRTDGMTMLANAVLATALTAEEREALEKFVSDSGEPHAYGDAPIMRNIGLAALSRLLADGQQLKAGEK